MIILKYWNEKLQIALLDWRNVYQFPLQEKMSIEVQQGNYIIVAGMPHNDLPF